MVQIENKQSFIDNKSAYIKTKEALIEDKKNAIENLKAVISGKNEAVVEENQKIEDMKGDIANLEDDIARSENAKGDILRDALVKYMAYVICEEACNNITAAFEPTVVKTADRYLAMMTNGEYRMDLNPLNDDIFITNGKTKKKYSQWSTGLRAQVMLSLKLALAKELSEGQLPVIMDDILLPFDTKRKKGACEALAEVSKEMQLLMFTCDDQTKEFSDKTKNTTVLYV